MKWFLLLIYCFEWGVSRGVLKLLAKSYISEWREREKYISISANSHGRRRKLVFLSLNLASQPASQPKFGLRTRTRTQTQTQFIYLFSSKLIPAAVVSSLHHKKCQIFPPSKRENILTPARPQQLILYIMYIRSCPFAFNERAGEKSSMAHYCHFASARLISHFLDLPEIVAFLSLFARKLEKEELLNN